jgi:hypothetical protein
MSYTVIRNPRIQGLPLRFPGSITYGRLRQRNQVVIVHRKIRVMTIHLTYHSNDRDSHTIGQGLAQIDNGQESH